MSPRAVERIVRRIEEAIKLMPEKFPGRVVKVIYCMRAMPGAIEEANKHGIWLLESGRELTKPNI